MRRHASVTASAIALAERPDAAFALQRLEDDRAGRFGHRRQERVGIVRRHELHAGEQRRKRRAVVVVPGHRQRAHRPAVERVLEGDETRTGARPSAHTSSGARTSGRPRPPPRRCCRRTRAAARTNPRAASRLPPAAGGSTGSTCGAASPPARRGRRPDADSHARAPPRRRPRADRGSRGRRHRTDGSRARARRPPGCACRPAERARSRAPSRCWLRSSSSRLHVLHLHASPSRRYDPRSPRATVA